MRRMMVVWVILWASALPFCSAPEAGEMDVDIKAFVCSEGVYFIRFGVINRYTYDPNPTIAFKIIKDGRPIACEKIILHVPPGSDGSREHELYIEKACFEEEGVTLESRIFTRDRRNKVGPWLGDCP